MLQTYEDEYGGKIRDLARRLGCCPSEIRPCLVDAYELPADKYAKDTRLTHAICYFVGAELLSIAPSAETGKTHLRKWASEKRIDSRRITQLLGWFARNHWRRRGCTRENQIKRLCCGRALCGYYRKGRWKSQPTANSTLNTFYLREWPRRLCEREGYELGAQAVRMYGGLCAFEAAHGIVPGSRLLFTASAGRSFCDGMRETVQRKALECLRRHCLVTIPTWGRKRLKGQPNAPRTVRRVCPVPVGKT